MTVINVTLPVRDIILKYYAATPLTEWVCYRHSGVAAVSWLSVSRLIGLW